MADRVVTDFAPYTTWMIVLKNQVLEDAENREIAYILEVTSIYIASGVLKSKSNHFVPTNSRAKLRNFSRKLLLLL